MQLTKFTDYSLRCLLYLSNHPDKYTSIKQISEFYQISYEHLTKVAHTLAVEGYIESKKGKNGGIILTNKALNEKFGNLVVKLEPNMDIVECFNSETNTCRITTSCKLKFYLNEAKLAFIDKLNKYKLSDVSHSFDLF